MNATRILVAQHRAIGTLFEELVHETRRLSRRRAVSRLTEELIAHMAAEESIFYPAARAVLRRKAGSGDRCREQPDEHFMLRAQLRRVLATSMDVPAFAFRLDALKLLFEHHVELEESEIFPRVEAAMGPLRLQALGAEVLGARPPVWVVTTDSHASMASNGEPSRSGVRLPSLREN